MRPSTTRGRNLLVESGSQEREEFLLILKDVPDA
jgi:hypothetical protein